jgi:hypothetical protein
LKELTLFFQLNPKELLEPVQHSFDVAKQDKLNNITRLNIIYHFPRDCFMAEFGNFVSFFELFPNLQKIVFNTNYRYGINCLLKAFEPEISLVPKLKYLEVFFQTFSYFPEMRWSDLGDIIRKLLNCLSSRSIDKHEPITLKIGIDNNIDFSQINPLIVGIIPHVPMSQVIGFHFAVSNSQNIGASDFKFTRHSIELLLHEFAQSELSSMELSVSSVTKLNEIKPQIDMIQEVFESFDSDFFHNQLQAPISSITVSAEKHENRRLMAQAVTYVEFCRSFEWKNPQLRAKRFQFKASFGKSEKEEYTDNEEDEDAGNDSEAEDVSVPIPTD